MHAIEHQHHTSIGSRLKTAALYAFGIVMLGLLAVVLIGPPKVAGAADLGNHAMSDAALADSTATKWTGVGVGLSAAYLNGLAMNGGTFGFGSNAEVLTPSISYDQRFNSIVVGIQVSDGFLFGNLHALAPGVGVNSDLTVAGRLGVLTSPNALLFTRVGWSQLSLSGMKQSSVDGWKVGGGMELKLPVAAPLFMTAEYQHGMYNVTNIAGPGVSASTDTVMLGITYKLWSGAN